MSCNVLCVAKIKTTRSKCLDEYKVSLDGIFHFKVCGLLCGHLGKNL